jgi:DNA-binding response OmpR family regulator
LCDYLIEAGFRTSSQANGNRVQGYDFEGYDRTIDTHIKNLRKKIAEIRPNQEIFSTVYGVGYRFNESLDGSCTRRKNIIFKLGMLCVLRDLRG